MSTKNMHYDLKQKLNKLDSQRYKNLKIQEIDWKLNEAMGIFIKVIAEPRIKNKLGFEMNQRTIDDIRTIVVNTADTGGTVPTAFNSTSYSVPLPENYLYYANIDLMIASKGNCKSVKMEDIIIRQHNDDHENSPFDKSNFEWRAVNCRFFESGLRMFTDGTFTIDKVCFNYIRKPKYMHNAEDTAAGQYSLPDGTLLTGFQDCELPEAVHSEIVDIAVLIIAGDLQVPDLQTKQFKLKLAES